MPSRPSCMLIAVHPRWRDSSAREDLDARRAAAALATRASNTAGAVVSTAIGVVLFVPW